MNMSLDAKKLELLLQIILFPALIVGVDSATDIALLKVNIMVKPLHS